MNLTPMLTADEEAVLLDFALGKLWQMSRVGDHCCPRCCGACHVIESVIGSGRANVLLRERMIGDERWDMLQDELDETWIMAVWTWPEHVCGEEKEDGV